VSRSDHPQARPIGWWLKEADARLDAAFDHSLAAHGVDRRGWQVLATLAGQPTSRDEIVAVLAPFDPPAVVDAVVSGLIARGWVEGAGDRLRLTSAGQRQRRELAPLVDQVRQRVAAALPNDDYVALIRLLQRLVDALTDPAPART
jgi:hypothetical protein